MCVLKVDELYREGVKPWRSVGWKPHLAEEYHKNHPEEVYEDVQKKEEA